MSAVRGSLPNVREGHVEHPLLLEAQAEELLVLEVLGGDVAGLLLARGEPAGDHEAQGHEQGQVGIEDLEPEALLHVQERRPPQEDQGEARHPDEDLGGRQAREEPGPQHAGGQEEPHSKSQAHTGARTKSTRNTLSRKVA